MQQNRQLIPYHTHTVYSLLDCLIKIDDYVAWGKENNMPALAVTDHGALGSSISFYKKCKENNIKPILGMEAYLTMDAPDTEEKTKDNYHLILLCKNKTGWLNLIKLHNLSYYNFLTILNISSILDINSNPSSLRLFLLNVCLTKSTYIVCFPSSPM